jgi:RimJ/RimL family protein N-acetyltransferase
MFDHRPGPVTVCRKLGARIRARGPREVLDLMVGRVREFVGSDDRLIMHVHSADEQDGTSTPEDLEFKSAEPSDAPAYSHDIGTDSVNTFRMRLSDNTVCFLVVRDGLVVHATWGTFSSAWTRELQRYFCPPPGDLYVYESYTRPEVRGRGVYPFALRQIARWAAERGIKRLWVGVEHDNPASLKAVAKAGFTPAFEVSFGRRLGRLTVHPPAGPRADDCTGCISETPCTGENLPPRG